MYLLCVSLRNDMERQRAIAIFDCCGFWRDVQNFFHHLCTELRIALRRNSLVQDSRCNVVFHRHASDRNLRARMDRVKNRSPLIFATHYEHSSHFVASGRSKRRVVGRRRGLHLDWDRVALEDDRRIHLHFNLLVAFRAAEGHHIIGIGARHGGAKLVSNLILCFVAVLKKIGRGEDRTN